MTGAAGSFRRSNYGIGIKTEKTKKTEFNEILVGDRRIVVRLKNGKVFSFYSLMRAGTAVTNKLP
jgi:hypothetical protein